MKSSKYPNKMQQDFITIGDRINIAKEHQYGERIPDTTLAEKITKRYKDQYQMATSYLAELRSENKAGRVKALQADKLYALAEELGVTTDYLLGLSPTFQVSNKAIDNLGLSTNALNNLEKLKKYSTEYPYECADTPYPDKYQNQFLRQLTIVNMLLESIEFDEKNPEKSKGSRILELLYNIIYLCFDNYINPRMEVILNSHLMENRDCPSYEEDNKMINDFIHNGIISVTDKLTGISTTYTAPPMIDVMCTELITLLKNLHSNEAAEYFRNKASASNQIKRFNREHAKELPGISLPGNDWVPDETP